MSTTDIA